MCCSVEFKPIVRRLSTQGRVDAVLRVPLHSDPRHAFSFRITFFREAPSMDTYFSNASHHGLGADTSAASLSFGEKRKHADDEIDDANLDNLAEYCRQVRTYAGTDRQSVVPRTESQRKDGDGQVQFYPLPPELNQAVLNSLGAGTARHSESEASPSLFTRNLGTTDARSAQSSPGLLQPSISSDMPFSGRTNPSDSCSNSDCMEEEVHTPREASTSHGPHCKSIPQLSVRNYGGTASQLWALCPDCGAFSKVHEDKPVLLCYSP